MMQPPRQMRAVPARSTFHPYCSLAAEIMLKPWAYAASLAP